MTAVALRCAAALRRTSLVFGALLVLLVAIPFSIDPLRFPWHVVTEQMPMRLLALPSIGLVMAILGLVPSPLLLTRTFAVLLGGVAILALLGTTPGAEVGIPGAVPVALVTASLILTGAAGLIRRVAPWSNVARPIAGIAILCALVLYLVPGIASDGLLVTGAVKGLEGASGIGLFVGIAALVPLALAILSLSTLLPPTSVGPSVARLLGGIAVMLPATTAAVFVVQSGAASAGLAAILAIVLLAGFVWPAAGVAVLVYGLFGSDEPAEEHGGVVDDFDPSQYFGDKTQQMDAWQPEEPAEDGEATRIVQSPAAAIERTARAAADRGGSQRPVPAPSQAPRPVPAAQQRPAPRPRPEPDEPDDSDRTVMLDRPLGKKRK